MTLLETLRALAPVVTPGEWQHHMSHVYGPDPDRQLVCQFRNGPWLVSDRDLIVTLRNALPELIAALEVVAAERAAHAQFRQEVSDSVEHYLDQWRNSTPSREVFACQFGSFIIPEPVDPLVEAVRDCGYATLDAIEPEFVADLRTALAKRGLKLVEVGDAD